VSYGGPGRTCPLLRRPILSGFPDTRWPARSGPIPPFSDRSVARLLHAAEPPRMRHKRNAVVRRTSEGIMRDLPYSRLRCFHKGPFEGLAYGKLDGAQPPLSSQVTFGAQ
jgi:hypothetical protein